MPEGQGLAVPAQQHLLVGQEPGQPDRVDVHLVHDRAAGTVQGGDGGIGRRPEPGRRPRVSDQRRRPGRGARWRVHLGRVVEFDDLRRVEEARRLRGEAHHEDGADREVRHDQRPGARRGGQPPGHLPGPGVIEAGCADDGVQALADTPAQVVHDHARMGEVDDHVAAGQRLAVVAHIHPGGERHIFGRVDRRGYLRAHAPLGAQHPDLDHVRLLGPVQGRQASGQRRREAGIVVERADHRERLGQVNDLGGDPPHVVVGDRLDRGQDLLHRLQPRVDQFGLAEPAHP